MLSQGKRAEAEKLLRQFLNRFPRSLLAPNASMFLGKIVYEKGAYAEALRWFSPYLKPESPILLRLRAHQWTGAIQRTLGKLDAADRHYRTALRLAKSPADRASPLRPLVRLALDRKRPAEAVKSLTALIPLVRDLKENAALKQQTVDLIFLHLNLPAVERLVQQGSPGFPAGYLSVRQAELLLNAGRREAARERLSEFLARSKGHPLSARAARLLRSIAGPSSGPAKGPGVPVVPPQAGTPTQGGVLNVGVLLPVSGAGGEMGEQGLQGVQLALQHAGALAERVKLQVLDSGGSAAAADLVKKLSKNGGTAAILGPLQEPQASTAALAAQEIGIPLVLPITPSSDSPARPTYVFRTGITDARQAEAIAVHSVEKLGLRTFAILYPSAPSGLVMREVFRRRVIALGGRVVREASYPANSTDFGRQIRALGGMDDEEVERLKKAREEKRQRGGNIPHIPFQALFIPDRSAQVALIVPSLSFYNIRGVILLGGTGWNSPEVVALAKKGVEGAYFVGGYSQVRPTARRARFARDFQRTFLKAPSETAAFTYDAMRFLLMGLRAAGAERAAVRQSLAGTKNFDGVTGRFSIGPSGTAHRELPILTISRGEIVPAAGSAPAN